MLILALATQAQTADEVEKRIANLPASERAYERFRFWFTQLPPDEQRSPDNQDRYRAYLKQRGFADAEVDSQLTLIEEEGRRSEVARWNRILTADRPAFNTNPNEFLVQMATGRKPGRALDVGMGQGRNTIWLAQQGWDTTGFDPAEKGRRAGAGERREGWRSDSHCDQGLRRFRFRRTTVGPHPVELCQLAWR